MSKAAEFRLHVSYANRYYWELPCISGPTEVEIRLPITVLPKAAEYQKLVRRLTVATLLLTAASAVFSSETIDSNQLTAKQFIESTAEHLVSAIDSERERVRDNPRRLREITEEHVLQHIDFQLVSRLVLGKQWRRASTQQKDHFTTEFRKFLARFYTSALSVYLKGNDVTKGKMTFLTSRENERGNKVTVRSLVQRNENAQSIPVNYRLKLRENRWKVYDVVVDGISMIATYRNGFATEVRKSGMDGLIAQLIERNAEFEK